jgi:uncharacterized protein (TIGR02453 family)
MSYFSPKFVDFFKGLAANNHKDYFDENRKTYIKEVKEPFQKLLLDVRDEIAKSDPEVKKLELKNAVFRINRDIRFSKDKTPYNLHVSAVVSPYGRKDMQYPGLYIHLSIDKCHLGGGMYMPSKENLAKIRQHIINHPKDFEKAMNDKEFNSIFGGLVEGEKNKVLPKEFKEYGEQYPAIFNKQFYYMAEYEGEKSVLREDLLPFIVSHSKAAKVWDDWFKAAIS